MSNIERRKVVAAYREYPSTVNSYEKQSRGRQLNLWVLVRFRVTFGYKRLTPSMVVSPIYAYAESLD